MKAKSGHISSRTPASASTGSDSLEFGEHTAEILAEEGFSQDTIHRLLRDKVVQQADLESKL